uniref:Putative peptidoglycan recognition protein n=1 Tax=Ixodes ricinus TaxID=34613 RepID=A0A0K8R6M9_IXORI
MLTAAGTGRNSEKDMGISAAMLSFVLLVSERIAGEGASVATAAISQRITPQESLLPRNVTPTHNPGKSRSYYYGLNYRKLEMCQEIDFVSRDDWGAKLPKAVKYFSINGGVRHVLFHHTEGQDCFCKKKCAEIVLKWQEVHQEYQGWNDIGYNFMIGGNGMVLEGRGWNQVGAHTVGFNNKSVSFGFVGDYTDRVPNERMIKAAMSLIKCGIQLKTISPNYTLHGQADADCRRCPGEAFHAYMRSMPNFGGRLKDYKCTPSPWKQIKISTIR